MAARQRQRGVRGRSRAQGGCGKAGSTISPPPPRLPRRAAALATPGRPHPAQPGSQPGNQPGPAPALPGPPNACPVRGPSPPRRRRLTRQVLLLGLLEVEGAVVQALVVVLLEDGLPRLHHLSLGLQGGGWCGWEGVGPGGVAAQEGKAGRPCMEGRRGCRGRTGAGSSAAACQLSARLPQALRPRPSSAPA